MAGRHASWRRRGQSGQSLIELLIAVMLLATVFLSIAGGIFTVVKVTQTNEHIQIVDSALITYGEILRTQIDYRACGGGYEAAAVAGDYQSDAEGYIGMLGPEDLGNWMRPPYLVVEIVSPGGVESWDPAQRSFAAGCLIPDTGIQRVTYRATFQQPTVQHPDPNDPSDWEVMIVREGQVVKRKDSRS